MYPFLRLAKELIKFRKAPPLGLFDTHHSTHICWPWDLDMFLELNNGRALSLYDLGRITLANRVGLFRLLREQGWMMTIAGSSVRYRKRLRAFERFEMRSRCLGYDEKFFYLEHAMWRHGACTSHILVRMAFTDDAGLVRSDRVVAAFGNRIDAPELPDWVKAWSAADNLRPWPPFHESVRHETPLERVAS